MATDHAHCDLSGHWKDKSVHRGCCGYRCYCYCCCHDIGQDCQESLYIQYVILKGQMLRNHGEVEVGGGCIALSSKKRQKRNL